MENAMSATQYSLAELMICANASIYADDGEILVTGIGVLPRIAASLAMKTCNTDIMMTDSEAWILSEPNPVGPRPENFQQQNESWMGFSRIFDNVWSGKRHITGGPTQMDRYGQSNISAIGGTHAKPKVQMLGARGFPGNSICHANSFMVPAHSNRVFVETECDMVCTIGYNPQRLPRGYVMDDIDLRKVITDLCVMDFGGPDHQMRVVSLHPGISVEQVVENTGFELAIAADLPTTAAPTQAQLALIAVLDPHQLRAKQLRDNPVGYRS
ncbi:MAG: glutaconate CoA-transferase subunit B [Halieaceae bacterium]|jgi:glutaconate CoA-transferase subunit B